MPKIGVPEKRLHAPARQYNFTYDDAGHLLTQAGRAPQPSGQACPSGSATITRTVDAAGLITSTPASSLSSTYDGADEIQNDQPVPVTGATTGR